MAHDIEMPPTFVVERYRDSADAVDRLPHLSTGTGTKVFAFGREVPMVVSVHSELIVGGPDEVLRTRITLELYGAQVETVFRETGLPKA